MDARQNEKKCSCSCLVLRALQGGKLGQSLGSAVFNGITVAAFTLIIDTNKTDDSTLLRNPWILATAGTAMIASSTVCRYTRLSSMARKWWNKRSRNCCISCGGCNNKCVCIQSKQQCTATFVSSVVKVSSWMSAMFVTINTKYFAERVVNFFTYLFKANTTSIYSKVGIGVYVGFTAASNLYSYISLTIKQSEDTAEDFSKLIRNEPLDNEKNEKWKKLTRKNLQKTCLILFINAFPTITFAFYSTLKALLGAPWVQDQEETILESIAIASTFFAFTTSSASNISGILEWLTEEKESKEDIHIGTFNPVNIANIVDSLLVMGANVAGTALFCEKKFGVNPYNIWILVMSGLFASVTGYINFTFSRQAHKATLIYEKLIAESTSPKDKVRLIATLAHMGEEVTPEQARAAEEEFRAAITRVYSPISNERERKQAEEHFNDFAITIKNEIQSQKDTYTAKLKLKADSHIEMPESSQEEKSDNARYEKSLNLFPPTVEKNTTPLLENTQEDQSRKSWCSSMCRLM